MQSHHSKRCVIADGLPRFPARRDARGIGVSPNLDRTRQSSRSRVSGLDSGIFHCEFCRTLYFLKIFSISSPTRRAVSSTSFLVILQSDRRSHGRDTSACRRVSLWFSRMGQQVVGHTEGTSCQRKSIRYSSLSFPIPFHVRPYGQTECSGQTELHADDWLGRLSAVGSHLT